MFSLVRAIAINYFFSIGGQRFSVWMVGPNVWLRYWATPFPTAAVYFIGKKLGLDLIPATVTIAFPLFSRLAYCFCRQVTGKLFKSRIVRDQEFQKSLGVCFKRVEYLIDVSPHFLPLILAVVQETRKPRL